MVLPLFAFTPYGPNTPLYRLGLFYRDGTCKPSPHHAQRTTIDSPPHVQGGPRQQFVVHNLSSNAHTTKKNKLWPNIKPG
eukprot:4166834-Amphidinium_carterae.1